MQYKGIALSVTIVGTLMAGIDTRIIIVGLPTVAREIGTILGINQIAFRIGSVAGLTLSGAIIAVSGWRALFYVNIPIGVFGTLWAHLRLREISTLDPRKNMDWPGFATFTGGLTMVLLAITLLSYGITEALPGLAMLALGVILLLYFVRIEMRSSTPLLDLRLFKIRAFAAGNIAQLFNALAWFGIVLMLSFYMQIVFDFTALKTGLSLLPLEVAFVLFGPISGKLSDKYGARLFSTLGLSVSSAGIFWLTQVNIIGSYSELIIPLILLGIGSGMFIAPNISSIMTRCRPIGGAWRPGSEPPCSTSAEPPVPGWRFF